MKQSILIDGHVHVYPQFNFDKAISHAIHNFHHYEHSNSLHVILLAERSDCHFFQAASDLASNSYTVEKLGESASATIKKKQSGDTLLYLLAGRQIVSRENLEICALATTFSAKDRQMSAVDLVRAVNENGGIAAVNWAPGKWFGERGQVVETLFDTFAPNELFISDTTMRPTVWATPRLMQQAIGHGFRVICGSDPLPFAGEEKMIATYGSRVVGVFDASEPAASLIKILKGEFLPHAFGRRSGPIQFGIRQARIMMEKRKSPLAGAE